MSLRSIKIDRKRAASPFFAPQPPKSQILTTPGGSIRGVRDVDEQPKSSVSGAAFNLINAIVGAGIVGIPFAINRCSLVLGFIMVNLFALLTSTYKLPYQNIIFRQHARILQCPNIPIFNSPLPLIIDLKTIQIILHS